MRIKRRTPVEKARIELIPMIDTMAFLLVFFMIASLAMTQQLGVPVNLPRADSATQQPSSDRTLVVTADAKGQLFINKQRVAWHDLEPAVRARIKARPELVIVLNADGVLHHRYVMRIQGKLRRAGANQLLIAEQPEGERPRTP